MSFKPRFYFYLGGGGGGGGGGRGRLGSPFLKMGQSN